LPDTIAEVKAIIARALHDLEQVTDNPGVKSLLHSLGSLLGIEDDAMATTTKPVSQPTSDAKPKPVAAPRARRRTPPRAEGGLERTRELGRTSSRQEGPP